MKALYIFENYSMSISHWLGFLGVLQILLAYFLSTTGMVRNRAFALKILNFSGALMAFFAAYMMSLGPFMFIGAIWYVISFINLIGLPQKSITIGETNLRNLIANMNPYLNYGEYVFVSVSDLDGIDKGDAIGGFIEEEGTTLILRKDRAMELEFPIDTIMSWITLRVNSSLEAVGFTAAFSRKLAKNGISCNVVAGYCHDHIFVNQKNAAAALKLLNGMVKNNTKRKFKWFNLGSDMMIYH